jgi:serine/threonine protein kinase
VLVLDAEDPADVMVKLTDFGIARYTPVERSGITPAPYASSACDPNSDTDLTFPPTSDLDTVSHSVRPPSGSKRVLPPPSSGDTGLITRSGQVAGTPLYMAPELARRGVKATSKADVYSVGVLAWELLAKRRPSLRPAAAAILAGEVPEPIPSVAPVAQSVPLEVSRMIDACLALDPEQRPSAEDLMQALEKALKSMMATA